MTRAVLRHLADALLGPRCPRLDCRYRARGPRTLARHTRHHQENPHA